MGHRLSQNAAWLKTLAVGLIMDVLSHTTLRRSEAKRPGDVREMVLPKSFPPSAVERFQGSGGKYSYGKAYDRESAAWGVCPNRVDRSGLCLPPRSDA